MNVLRYARPAVVCLLPLLITLCLLPSYSHAYGTNQQGKRPARRSENPNRKYEPKAGNADYFSSLRPQLILIIVVDQFRYDYLTRFGDLFVEGGLRRLLRTGAVWTNTNYDHMPTVTAPGHATLMTGAWPAENGIVGNDWYDRDSGKNVASIFDDTVRLLGGIGAEQGASPRRLMASSLGDELRLITNGRAKVIGISLKDRSAILPAGRRASAAYWLSTQSGRMVSSNYYFERLPLWVDSFNESRPADKYFGARWERLLPEREYLERAGPDAAPWEKWAQNTFPHVMTGGANEPGPVFYEELLGSPFANDLLLSFAKGAIINEGLGTDKDTDILIVSFSSNDYVGHRFGPYSHEVMDITLRVDRQINALLDFVNERVGLNRTLVAFSADHGVAPSLEQAASLGLPGGRVKVSDVLKAVRAAIDSHYGRGTGASGLGQEYVQAFSNGSIYFNLKALERDKVSRAEIERLAGEAAMTVPGIRRYFTRTQLLSGNIPPDDALARRVQHGFYPQRSGDVIIVYEPFKYLQDSGGTATHGSPYSYDTHVPLIIMGAGINAGVYPQAATPADLAPTLSQLLRIETPSNATGRVLTEALAK